MNARILLEKVQQDQRLALPAALLSGALLVLAFAPFDIVVLPLVLVAFLLWLLEGVTPRVAAWRGFAFGFGLFGVGMHWLYISLHVYGKAPSVLAIVLMLGLVAIMALYYATFAWLLNRFWPAGAGAVAWRRNLLAAPALWVLLEWLRSWFLSGFPWFSLGYSQVDTWLVAYAPVGGVLLVSLAVLVLAGAVRMALRSGGVGRFVSASVILATVLGGYLLGGVEWTEPTGKTLRVALVQGNIPQERKWLPEYRQKTIDTYLRLTREVAGDSDLIIWPEAAIPMLYEQLDETLYREIEEKLLTPDQRLLTGTLVRDERGVFYNSAVVLGGDERRFYHKRHLVPFGEYFPVPNVMRDWLRLMNLPYSDFEPGVGDNALEIKPGVTAVMMICYEVVFGSEVTDAMPEASFIINISNDGWFGGSIGPKQHFQIARFRSVQYGRVLARATNTGITAFVGKDGIVSTSLPAHMEGVVMAKVPMVRATGNPLLFDRANMAIFLILLIVVLSRARSW